MLIVGGGYIALEMACILHGLGVAVTLAYRRDLFLRGFDLDLRTALRDAMLAKCIDIRFDTRVTALEKSERGIRAVLHDGGGLEVDQVLMATGRKPLTDGLGLDRAGVAVRENGAVCVDEYSRTNVEHIWAVGDVTDRMSLTPVAIEEAMALAKTVFEDTPTQPDYQAVATAIFTQPPAATVGLTEEQAREQVGDVAVFRSRFRPLKHTLSGRDEQSMMKVVVDRPSNRVLGMHLVGPDAGEIIQGFAAAMKSGLTKAQLDATVAVHPTLAEEFVTMYREATR
jgi:glutathione reductase (NADPH)